MRYFRSTGGSKILVVFDRGDLLLEGLQEVVRREGIDTAVITAGIGTLDRCNLHWITGTGVPSSNEFGLLEGPLVMGSVQGNVINGEPHVHVCLADLSRTYAGHLEAGSRVCYRSEVCIEPVEGVRLETRKDEATGLVEIVAQDG